MYQSPRPVPITKKVLTKLKKEQERTGKTATALLKGKTDIPDDLTQAEILKWFDPYGPAHKAFDTHIEYIFKCYAMEPDKARFKSQSKRVKISKSYLQKLKAEQERTGASSSDLLKTNTGDIPKGLKVQTIYSWSQKKVHTAFPEYMDFVLERYKALPTKLDEENADFPVSGVKKYSDIRQESLEEISETDFKKLKFYQSLGFLPGRVLKLAQDAPNALSSHLIASWLSGTVKKADPALLEWALKRCEEMQKFRY